MIQVRGIGLRQQIEVQNLVEEGQGATGCIQSKSRVQTHDAPARALEAWMELDSTRLFSLLL